VRGQAAQILGCDVDELPVLELKTGVHQRIQRNLSRHRVKENVELVEDPERRLRERSIDEASEQE
tara:strand:+ start:140 stop:334 length:195 start_codon:yes stop_codon:yes gene_type:complete